MLSRIALIALFWSPLVYSQVDLHDFSFNCVSDCHFPNIHSGATDEVGTFDFIVRRNQVEQDVSLEISSYQLFTKITFNFKTNVKRELIHKGVLVGKIEGEGSFQFSMEGVDCFHNVMKFELWKPLRSTLLCRFNGWGGLGKNSFVSGQLVQ